MSQNSSEKSAERIRRAHRAIAEEGRWKGGGPRPLGYEADGVTIREVEAAVVREAADFILAGGSTVKAAQWVSERLDRKITAASLGKSLRSPHIAGHRLHVPQAQRDVWESRRAAGEVVGEQPPHALSTHTRRGTWEPVIDEETWRQLLGHYRAAGSGARPRRSLLAGLLRCSECGHILGWGESKALTANGRFATYRCVSTTGGCGRISIAAEPIEAYVSELLRGALIHASPSIDSAMPKARQADSGARRRALEARMDDLADAYGDGELSRAQHLRLREKLQSELGQLEDDGATLLNEARARAQGLQIVAKWDAAANEERNAAARALLTAIWVYSVGRGGRVLPIHRVAVVWKDDHRGLTAHELRAEVAAPPAPLTHQERLAIRATAARVKRQSAREQAGG